MKIKTSSLWISIVIQERVCFWNCLGAPVIPAKTEDPLVAAKRELLEETGYESDEWIYVGAHHPNPAIQTNRCHLYIAKNCKKTSELNLDPFEEIEVRLMPLEEFEKHLHESDKKHSLMLAYVSGESQVMILSISSIYIIYFIYIYPIPYKDPSPIKGAGSSLKPSDQYQGNAK